ncbi:MAG: OmpA family protein [Bacteroidales bacterium]|nr:OmpA family protein [Bacteroidales bacterium]
MKTPVTKNHLGNVLVTVSAKPRLIYDQNDVFLNKEADVTSVSDYYPFGSLLPERHWQSDTYRFGFNGKERDNEGMGGGGSTYDYGFRIYNAQIGKFLSVDPLTKSYPWYTPYQFAGNKPIIAIDLDGLEEFIVIDFINESEKVVMTMVTYIETEVRTLWVDPHGNSRDDYIQYKTANYISYNRDEFNSITKSPNYIPNGGGIRNAETYDSRSPEGFLLDRQYRKVNSTGTITGANALRNNEAIFVNGDANRGTGSLQQILKFKLPLNFNTDVYNTVTNPVNASIWLDELAAFMITNSNLKIDISGHTDNVPTNSYARGNVELSEKRANFVVNELINRGIPQTQFGVISGKADSEPLPGNTNTNDAERSANRRIEINFNYDRRQ